MEKVGSIRNYHLMVKKMREYFDSLGFIEVFAQGERSILAACEDPKTIATYKIQGVDWPLPQTGQMHLERVLLRNPDLPGVYCTTTSYRDERDPIPGRHDIIFPMFEVESKGTIDDLEKRERGMLSFLGFPDGPTVFYEDACKKYDVDIIGVDQEAMLSRDYGSVVFLKNFPERTSPFWNMKRNTDGLSNKIDVIIHGHETIGSAERSCDPSEMWEGFHTISGGEYAQTLYERFGRARVEKELKEFLSHDFFPRFGWGSGINPRLENGMVEEGLL